MAVNNNNFTIFYSWQSDLPPQETRNAIKAGLRNVATSLESGGEALSVILDEATRGRSGSPNIPRTIMEKIEEADLFVADISTINSGFEGRKTPNPNVVFELGFAVSVLGWERVILMFNETFGDMRDLPFDFDRHRASKFTASNKNEKENLNKLLLSAVNAVLKNNPEKPLEKRHLSDVEIKKKRDVKNLDWILSQMHFPTIYDHIENAPNRITDRILTFWEMIRSVYNSPLFHIYDENLNEHLKKVITHLGTSLAFAHRYKDNGAYPNNSYIFETPGDIFADPGQQKDWGKIETEVLELSKNLDTLLAYIRENYITIDLDSLNDRAWKAYVDLHRDTLESIEGETDKK